MADKKSAISEFKDFILQGNVVDLAVAVIIATFFGFIIKDVVNLILSLLAIPGRGFHSFSDLYFTIGKGKFLYGALITDTITFVIVAAVVFFLVVRPTRSLIESRRRHPDPESTERPCPYCLTEIPKAASRCAACAADVPVVAEPYGH
jgi:large conductance mechanosensitive channel